MLNERLLGYASAKWGLSSSEMRFIRFGESYVYAALRGKEEVILRFTHQRHREKADIEAELDFIAFLSGRGLSVAKPLPSLEAKLVESVAGDDGNYCIAVFEKAPGRAPKAPEDFSDELLFAWGKLLGDMHQATKSYRPKRPELKRGLWTQEPMSVLSRIGLDETERLPYERFMQFDPWLAGLETSADCFGLIHADLHQGNFFFEGSRITAFDFDDSTFHWFVHDLACAISGIMRFFEEKNLPQSEEDVTERLLRGYESAHAISPIWKARIPLFVEFRALSIYLWCLGRLKTESIAPEMAADWRSSLPSILTRIQPSRPLI